MARINDQISSINSKAYLKAILSSIMEKTECIIFDATALIQMLPILSITVKVTSVAVMNSSMGTFFRPVASISQFHGYTLYLTCIGRIV